MSSVDLVRETPQPRLAAARFDVRSVAATVMFDEGDAEAPWRVRFNVEGDNLTEVLVAALEVFNGIMQAVEAFLEVRRPELLALVSENADLSHVYDAYLRREARRIERLGYRRETGFTLRLAR